MVSSAYSLAYAEVYGTKPTLLVIRRSKLVRTNCMDTGVE